MSGEKGTTKTNKKTRNTKTTNNSRNKSKVVAICSVCVILITIAVVCAVIFIPKINSGDTKTDFSEYANYPSSFPDYFLNLKEEKEAFARALSTCNKAAEAKLASKGIKTEYRETDIDIVNKWAGFNNRINAPYVEIGADPTGGDMEYKDYGKRTYHCYANISGASVYELNVIWDEKND